MEGWHSSFKARSSLIKKRLLGRRPDWLVELLVTEVDEHYAYLGRAKATGKLLGTVATPARCGRCI